MLKIWQRVGTEIVCVSLVMILFLPFCGFIFGCGCRHLWAGGLEHCNIHDPATPDCPWCSGPLHLQILPFVLVCLGAIAGIHLMRRVKTKHFLRDVTSGLLCAIVLALLLGWIYAEILGYPHFLGQRIAHAGF